MIILRNKQFSLKSKIRRAKNTYKTTLSMLEKDRKDPDILLKTRKSLEDGIKWDKESPMHEFDDKTNNIIYKRSRDFKGDNKKEKFDNKEDYETKKKTLIKNVKEYQDKYHSKEHIDNEVENYRKMLKHPKLSAIKSAIEGFKYYSEIENKKEKRRKRTRSLLSNIDALKYRRININDNVNSAAQQHFQNQLLFDQQTQQHNQMQMFNNHMLGIM